jgi:trigger factor
MQVSVEATSGLERRMTVQVPEERVEKEIEGRLQRLARTAKLKGFRPGKVPMNVVKSQYGAQVRQEVVGDVIQSSFYEAVVKENLRPAGLPTIEPKSLDAGKSIEYTATFEVMPEVTPASLKGVKLEKVSAEVTDADVDTMLETLRKQRTRWDAVERGAKDGDRVVIDFKGTIEAEEFKGNEGKQVPVVIGAKRMITGFEEGLVGTKAGQTLTLDLKFPEEYGYKEVAGKPVQFAVTVHRVEEPHLPELDDEFAKSFAVTEGGVEALRKEVRQNMERELEQAVIGRVKQSIMDKLIELNAIDLPKALIKQEAEQLAAQMRQNMHIPAGKSGVNLDSAMFEDQARRRVGLGLVLSEIIKRNELKADPAKVREQVEKVASTYERPQDVINWYYADRNRLAEVESLVLENQVVEWALKEADVTETKSSFNDLMNRGQ